MRGTTVIVGLTGGIGSGKSTAAQYFRQLGVPVIDADEIAREVVTPGQPALDRLTKAIGPDILDSYGRLDRARLRDLIFSDPEQRQRVEAVLHPAVRQEMAKRLAVLTAPYCIFAIPLLIETDQVNSVDRVLVIDSPEDLQRRRLADRAGWTSAQIEAAMRAQVSRAERLRHADDVIVNDESLESLEHAVGQLHRKYLTLAGKGRS